jgi:uncharacterized protein (TIGR03083 family)
MEEMRVEHAHGRDAFAGALAAFLDTVQGLDDRDLMRDSRCLGWTAGDVVAHVHLGLQEMLLGMVSPTTDAPDTDAASYWGHQPAVGGADELAGMRFVRLLGAAYQRPTGVVRHLRPTAEAVGSLTARLPAGALRFQGLVLTTGDFFATWAVELAVHHRDLRFGEPDPDALRLARRTAEARGQDWGRPM